MGPEYSAMDFASHQRASAAAGDSDSNYAHNNEDTYAANDGAGSDRDGTRAALGACFDDEACESDDSGGASGSDTVRACSTCTSINNT